MCAHPISFICFRCEVPWCRFFLERVCYSDFITIKATMLDRVVGESMVSISAERIGECR
jgi:hypothetical protein